MDIETSKVDIEDEKADIENRLAEIQGRILSKTKEHILVIYKEFGSDKVFGRSMIEKITGLKSSRASELIKVMLENGIVEPVQGYGKGRYQFKR